jgi:predicted phage terminase large subunit-like protein
VVELPAIAEAADPLGRAEGEALWPARWPLVELEPIRGVSERSWLAKYQQKPRPAEGSIFKKPWLRVIDAAPAGLKWVRYYDLAYSLKQQADNTSTIAGAFGPDGTLYLRRGRAGKMESPDARKMVKELMLDERDTRHGVEAKVHGAPMVQELMRDKELIGISLRAINVHVDKIARAQPVADRAEMGKLAFVRETVNDDAWIADWIDEMCAFPFAAHDDRVDAVSGVFAMMSTGTPGWVQHASSQIERMRNDSEQQAQDAAAQKEGQTNGG